MFKKTSPESLKDPLKNERIKRTEKLKQEIKAKMKLFSLYDKKENITKNVYRKHVNHLNSPHSK